ncbi:MAG: aldehyde ferredoxin oxidoreductase C-terminal domain-containing protein, partial [Planctomycetota bacterium]
APEMFEIFGTLTVDKDKIVDYSKYNWKTYDVIGGYAERGMLPVRNCTTSVLPRNAILTSPDVRGSFEIIERHPCWACPMIHSNLVRVTTGPYAGYEGKEPEYAHIAMWGPNIGVTDPGTIVMLCNVVDRLGLELMETGWIISWLMECYEKGLIGKKETDGIELTWGNAEAVKAMLTKIAKREGFGDILADGLKYAAAHVGGEASDCAVHTKRGTTPGAHDERAEWIALLDIIVSNTSWREHRAFSRPTDWGLPALEDHFSAEEVSTTLARIKGAQQFYNSVGVCIFCVGGNPRLLTQMLSAATGWDFGVDEALEVGKRVVNLLRVFNIRHGLVPDQETPAPRHGPAPLDGPLKGKNILPDWDYMQRNYYQQMGWDRETGKPLPETLRKLKLEHTISDIWIENAH